MVLGVNQAAEFLATAVRPIGEWSSEDLIVAYVEELGWTLPSVPSGFLLVRDSADLLLNKLGELMDADDANDTAAFALAIAEVIASLALVIGNIEDLPSSIDSELPQAYRDATAISANISRRLLDRLLVDAIRRDSQTTYSVLFALGIVDREEIEPAPPHQPAFTLHEVRLDRLKTLLTAPSDLLLDVYGWGGPTIDEQRLFEVVQALSFGLLGEPDVLQVSPQFLAAMFPGTSPAPEDVGEMLAVSLSLGFERAPLLIGVLPAPKADPAEAQALAFRLLGSSEVTLNLPLSDSIELLLDSSFQLDTGLGLLLRPGQAPTIVQNVETGAIPNAPGKIALTLRKVPGAHPTTLFDFGGGSKLKARSLFAELVLETPPADLAFRAGIEGGELVVSLGEGDGFIRSVVPAGEFKLTFDLGIGWSNQRGIFISGSAGLETLLALHLTLGPVLLEAVRLAIRVDEEGLRAQAGLHVAVTLGPITGVVQGIGVESQLRFEPGNLGPMDLGVKFLPPTGIGVLVDAGAVKGGGFLALDHDAGRYSGVIELSVFTVSVKAFGLLETKFPDGRDGYSFVIVIIAEFTPIQLGFGFTLVGVGGLIGVNRSLNEQALGDAVRTGSLAHLLFPRNPVQDAPAIINDLAAVFPASRAHYVFGPMAKLGWGTPTLITADLGIVIEFPGPRLAVLGVVRMLLPSPELALMRFQLAVAGVLDFPARTFALDASLFDSTVAGYVVTGDMAYRLGFGANAAFLLSVGGFNPGFQSPPAFPELRRASVDLGVSGNPSLVASGYFALTSNTAQVGAKIELRASGYGIRLNGHLGFDVLFVFSPFSFTASISAGVRVSFHGAGFGITLRGSLSGPTPWHVKGRVCVSVLWWDACLPIDVKFGRAEPAALPEMDPWEGTPEVTPPEEVDPRILVLGLRDAIFDPRNWSGSAPPAGFSVVSLAEAASAERTPIDPLGAATLRQKVVPLKRELEKFGEYKPIGHTLFDTVVVAINDVPEDNIAFVEDDFAPAHFTEFSGAERLSMPSYEKMDAGFSIAPDRVTQGTVGSATLEYETAFITAAGERFVDQPGDVKFKLTHEQLVAQLERSAPALGGIRRSGTQRYMLPLDREKKVVLTRETFVVADSCSHVKHGATGTYKSRSQALLSLRAHVRANPSDVNRFSVVPEFAAA